MRKLSDTKEKILFRRGMVTELKAKGLTDGAIAERLGVARTTIVSDVRVLRRQTDAKIEEFQAKLPYEYDTMITGVKLLLKRNCEILDNPNSSDKAVTNAAHIILSCYEKLSEQLKDKYEIMDGISESQPPTKLSLEEQAYKEAAEADYRRRQRVF
jgi:IS30 family transposase